MNTLLMSLPFGKMGQSRAINAENPTGEKGFMWEHILPCRLQNDIGGEKEK